MIVNSPFVFPIVCWNFRNTIQRCLESVFSQSCRDFTILLTDDYSTDGSYDLARSLLESQSGIPYSIYRNEQNTRLLSANRQRHYQSLEFIDPETIILNLDGDDFLADRHVVRYYQDLYSYTNALITFGQHRLTSGKDGHCRPYPDDVRKNRGYRQHRWLMSHMRTFKYKLWQNIRPEMINELCEDHATMFEMAEMVAPERLIFSPRVTYIYDYDTGMNAEKVIPVELEESFQRIGKYTKRDILFP